MNKKRVGVFVIAIISMISFSGFAAISDWFTTKKGTLIGNTYNIYQFDNSGNHTLTITGNHIDIEPYEAEVDEEGDKVINSVLDITIDDKQVITVGNTLIFEEKGIGRIASFEEIDNVVSNSGLKFMPVEKMLNSFQNNLGKSRKIIIYSQLGDPIGIYEGDSVYVTVPNDLPKMTRINIDGKSLYLHRVNYTIVDSDLIK